ncbi:hypothetical protein GFER_04475 [Geoalkalibacter ferrihydriticus DSM 17813]|uniref:Uncharacterized protein n=1 Tax=Geoalkalibacter ferrihydriticus DSM 17813 TaxID=1121915 RepID=A0A0C2HLC9_9BACT|nr:hypothetical protein GFER_04475 [Geoalkalibacter ferrihydriticus DSM 17813]
MKLPPPACPACPAIPPCPPIPPARAAMPARYACAIMIWSTARASPVPPATPISLSPPAARAATSRARRKTLITTMRQHKMSAAPAATLRCSPRPAARAVMAPNRIATSTICSPTPGALIASAAIPR